tara:strand:- start:173 stop:415 length:243 start_codon:yes stop_codon:yes gene_type:complete
MFDIGLPELLVILFVGLVIIGPEKLPEIIKNGTRFYRALKTYLNRTKSEVEKSVGLDEIRQDLHNEKVMESLKENKANKK